MPDLPDLTEPDRLMLEAFKSIEATLRPLTLEERARLLASLCVFCGVEDEVPRRIAAADSMLDGAAETR
jgi:hypothetical protein